MYIVHNMTTKTVILADLRAEIGPKKILDLEKVSHRDIIDRSHDLRQAIQSNRLRLIKYSVVKTHAVAAKPDTPHETVKIIEKDKLDDDRLRDLIKQAIAEEIGRTRDDSDSVEDTVTRIFRNGVKELQSSLRDQISNLNVSGNQPKEIEESIIDPERLAELQQQSVNKIEIETSGANQGKKVKIINTNLNDLADEL